MAKVLTDTPLAPWTTLGLAGRASRLVLLESEAEALSELRAAARSGAPYLILGGGSNVVIANRDVGPLYRIALRGVDRVRESEEGVILRAMAGEPWDALVEDCVAQGYSGIECLSGIPGLVGATPIQNVGAYGQEISDVLEEVRALDLQSGEVVDLRRGECEFGYRTSIFKGRARGRFAILSAVLKLSRKAPELPRYAELAAAVAALEQPATVASVRDTVLGLRRAKSMVIDPDDPDSRSVGSFFLNPVVTAGVAERVRERARSRGVLAPEERMPAWPVGTDSVKLAAGWLLERAGFSRGLKRGRVGLSRRHALAIVNRGEADGAEVLALAVEMKRAVAAQFGVRLCPEPTFVGFDEDELRPLLD